MYSVYVIWKDKTKDHMIFMDHEEKQMKKAIEYFKRLDDVVSIKNVTMNGIETWK